MSRSDLDADDAPPVEELTSEFQRLEPRVRLLWVVRATLVSFVVGVVVMAVERAFFEVFAPLGPLVFVVLAAIGATLAVLRYRVWRYRLREDALYLERGVVTEVNTVVPYVRVQHVDTRRRPVERLTGLATVVVYTAGSRGADVAIPGLTPERATDLQSRLERLAIAAEGEDAV